VTTNWCPTPEIPPSKDNFGVQGIVNLSSLCQKGWQPLLITGFFRDFLVRQWSSAINILTPELKQYLWSEGLGSGILIESVHRFRGDLVEKRPAIMIKRNSYRNLAMGFAGQIMGGGLAAYENEKGAISRYVTHFVGSHTLFCIHQTGASTEMLATEVQSQLVGFSPVIRKHLNLRQFSVAEVGAIQELEESTENYVVPITASWAYEHTWELREESLPLQALSLSSFLGENSASIRTTYQGP
jgi:hypothetical protein